MIADGERAEISIDSPEEKTFDSDRKLSQSEIDDLIRSTSKKEMNLIEPDE